MARRIRVFRQEGPGPAVRLILPLALLVLDHAALLVQLLLGNGPLHVAHAVRLQPQGQIQRVRGDVLEVVGAIGVGGAVHAGGADLLQGFEELAGPVFRPVEHQVLEKVGKPRTPRFLVFGPHVVPDVDAHDGRLVVLVDDQGETVGQDELLERDVDLGRHGTVGALRRESERRTRPGPERSTR